MLVAAIVLLAGSVTAASYVNSINQRLFDEGVQVPGVVTHLTPNRKHRSGSATVSYVAEGRTLTGRVDLGSHVSRYTVGKHVDVYYDPKTPTRMTIDGEENQPEWSLWLMMAALVVGLAIIPAAVWKILSWARTRRILAENPWREVQARTRMSSHNRAIVQIYAPVSLGLFRSPSISVRLRTIGPKQGVWTTTTTVWLAGPRGGHAVLAMPGGGDLLQLKAL